MPLKHNSSDEAFEFNVARLIKDGYSREQALAIAYSIQNQSKKSESVDPEDKSL